jgi:DNA polymerase-3 subunit epsilon
MPMTLARLPVLLLDAQATSSHPARGALLEMAWAPFAAGEASAVPHDRVATHVVAPPPGAVLPRAVARITGLHTAEWARGIAPGETWERLREAASGLAPRGVLVPAVIHYALFEEPFLRALHTRHGTGAFPFDIVCTHAIARRLFPELPRRTLRALAGYLGAGVPPRRRSADHVVATAFVWQQLVALLAEREGIAVRADLDDWLARPVRRTPRAFPLAREKRRALPDRPGVYRFERTGGAVLYVGKAASLRQRVSGHFHAHAAQGERALEMLTQVREVSWSVTETALEASLLESDEIKQLTPPYNVALASTGRPLWYATPDLGDLQAWPDVRHRAGPFVSPAPLEAFAALRALLADPRPASLPARARAVGTAPGRAPAPHCFADGLARFRERHGSDATATGLLRLGTRLWALRRAAAAAGPHDSPTLPSEGPERLAWDAERVVLALEETVLRAAHAARRGRWLLRLSECSLAWAEGSRPERRRMLVIQGGAVVARADLAPGAPLPPPPEHARPASERRAAFDLARFDRLRVLTTELRALTAEAVSVELRLGLYARLSRWRLQAVLRWL